MGGDAGLALDNRPPAGTYRVRYVGSILHRAEEGVAYVHEREYPVRFLCPTGRRATFCPDEGGVRVVGTEWLEMGLALFEGREAACDYLYGEADPALVRADSFLVVAHHEVEVTEYPCGGVRYKAYDQWSCRAYYPRGADSGPGPVLVEAESEEGAGWVAVPRAEPWEGMRLRGLIERGGLLRRDRGRGEVRPKAYDA